MKKFLYNFVTASGRHTITSFGKDIGLHNLKKLPATEPLNFFNGASGTLNKINNVFTVMRLINDTKNVVVGLLPNGENSVANNENSNVPYTSATEIATLGRELGIYHKTRIDIGRRSTSHLRNIQKGPFIQTITRNLSSSLDDYQSHERRKQLVLRSGFNERGFSFLAENHQMTISKYYKLFDLDKKKEILKKQIDGEKLLFGSILNTSNKIKLKNRSDIYTINVRIHLIKIIDLDTDLRTLLLETTNNEFTSGLDEQSGKLPLNFQYTDPDILNFDNKFSIDFTTSLECNLNLSTRFQERAKIIKSWNSNLPPGSIWDFECVHHLGKGINLNKIYDLHTNVLSIPLDGKNKKSLKYILRRPTSFTTTKFLLKIIDTLKINTNLQKELKKKVKQFESGELFREAPKETSNLRSQNTTKVETNEDEEEILIEQLEEESKNNHPISYIFLIEYIGDRRATILKIQNDDRYSGYSPVQLGCEFEHKIKYLAEDSSEDTPLTYKITKNETNFNEENDSLKDYFYPERSSKFHVPFKDILFNSGPMKTKNETTGLNKKYRMEYDMTLAKSPDNSIFDDISGILKSVGLDEKNKTADDLNLNYRKEPSQIDEDDN